MAVITISRQYGSGSNEIAARVCEILGYRYFDKKLMAKVASEVGLSEEELVDFSEERYKVRGFLDRLLNRPQIVLPEETEPEETADRKPWSVENLNEETCIAMVQKTIRAAYDQGNMVILGRGGQVILKDMAGVLHVRIEATLGARVMRVQEHRRISVAEAERLTRSYDEAADAYLKRYYDVDLANPLNYHLVINSGKWGIEASAQIIVNALSHLKTGLGI